MSNVGHAPTISADAAPRETFKQKLVPIAYFSTVAVAMAGWIWALGWAIYETASWLLA